jgi:hypothetical protein
VTGTKLKCFIRHGEMSIDLRVVETVQNSFGPVTEDVLVVAEEDVVTVEFDDLLEVKEDEIDVLVEEGEYF